MIAQKIKELRKLEGITQKELAKALRIDQSCISLWENGKTEPTASMIVALADYFNVCSDYLLGRQDWY